MAGHLFWVQADAGSIPVTPIYGPVVITGALVPCTHEVGVRFPSGPCSLPL
jgi:hypothetical protein